MTYKALSMIEQVELQKENAELKAMVNELLETLLAIQSITDNTTEVSDDNTEAACLLATKIISKTPAQSLADHDRALIVDEKTNPWKSAIIEAHVVNHTLTKEHYDNPVKALTDLVIYEGQLALDPKVSKQAQELCEAITEKVRERCAVESWNTGMDVYGKEWDVRNATSQAASRIRNLSIEELSK